MIKLRANQYRRRSNSAVNDGIDPSVGVNLTFQEEEKKGNQEDNNGANAAVPFNIPIGRQRRNI